MKQGNNLEQLRKLCFNVAIFPPEVLSWILKENLWNLWVPKSYNGLQMSFPHGLIKLKSLAKIDGSLGWTVTLCSGANYFIGNLQTEAAEEIFGKPESPVCFGGSGGVFGTAEKQGDSYKISGRWRYATGAPYLTHFTLNAKILQDGKELVNEDGSTIVRSFVLPKEKVEIIEDWNTIGLKASATHSFEVKNVMVHEKYSFLYNDVHLPHPIFKIPFSVFADLTLWANYIGMAEHFLEEALLILPKERLGNFESIIGMANEKMIGFAEKIENDISHQIDCIESAERKIHSHATDSVRMISKAIIEIYPFLGVLASRENHQLNQIFRNYFTATQHHIFTDR